MKSCFTYGLVIAAALCLARSEARADLIAHYTFDNGDATDDTGNLFDGTPDGDATPAGEGSGVDGTGQSFRFSGLGHIEIPIDVSYTSFPRLTVTMWVRADPTIVGQPGLYKTFGHDDGGWDRTFGLDNRPAADGFRWAAFTGGLRPQPTVSTGTPVTGAWTFLAAVWDTDDATGMATVRFHADDNFVVADINNTTGHSIATIGSLRWDNFNEAWRGLIDEVQIWDEALSIDDVEAIRDEVAGPQPGAPQVTTLPAGGLSSDGTATLRARVSPNGAETTYKFEWGETDQYGMETPEGNAGSDFSEVIVTAALEGLAVSTRYHFRIVASNENGTTLGADQEFIIPGRLDPIARYTFDSGEPLDDSGNGRDGTAKGDAFTAGPDSGVTGDGEAFQFGGAGQVEIPVDINSSTLSDLTVTMWVKPGDLVPDSPGLYRAFGHDDGGWDRAFGLDNRNGDFRWAAFNGAGVTGPMPTPVTSEWTFVAAVWDTGPDETTVRLHANENNITEPITNTPSRFVTSAIGSLRPDNFNEGWVGLIDEVQIFGAALTVEEVEAIRIEVLQPDEDAPTVVTLPASDLTSSGAVLNARVIPNGLATTAQFEWGLTTDYGNMTPEIDVGSGFAAIPLAVTLDGLDGETVYHFRAVAENEDGRAIGEDMTFRVPDRLVRLLYYSFDESEPEDESGNERHGTPEGDAVPGGVGSGFDGEGEAFEFFGFGRISAPIDVNPSAFPDLSVTMWVKPGEFIPDTPGLYKAFGHDDGGWDRAFGLDNRNGEFRYVAFTGNGVTGDLPTPVTPDWTFLAVVWDTEGDTATVRVQADDNVLTEEIVNRPSAFKTTSIGSINPDPINFNEGWVGLIDEVQIFGKALTEEEIEAIRTGAPPTTPFLRGDVRQDGILNITDALGVFGFLFLGQEAPTCLETMDVNADGMTNITDGIGILGFLFLGAGPPAAPFPECGSVDGLDPARCESHPPCAGG